MFEIALKSNSFQNGGGDVVGNDVDRRLGDAERAADAGEHRLVARHRNLVRKSNLHSLGEIFYRSWVLALVRAKLYRTSSAKI